MKNEHKGGGEWAIGPNYKRVYPLSGPIPPLFGMLRRAERDWWCHSTTRCWGGEVCFGYASGGICQGGGTSMKEGNGDRGNGEGGRISEFWSHTERSILPSDRP